MSGVPSTPAGSPKPFPTTLGQTCTPQVGKLRPSPEGLASYVGKATALVPRLLPLKSPLIQVVPRANGEGRICLWGAEWEPVGSGSCSPGNRARGQQDQWPLLMHVHQWPALPPPVAPFPAPQPWLIWGKLHTGRGTLSWVSDQQRGTSGVSPTSGPHPPGTGCPHHLPSQI